MNDVSTKIMNKKIIALAIFFVLLFIGTSLWWWHYSNRIVSTNDARVKGTMTTVSAKISGRVEQILVEEGSVVEAGQPIAMLEQKEYENKVTTAKANLEMAKAKLAEVVSGNRPQEISQANAIVLQKKSLYENSRKNYERNQALFQQNAISEQQLDAAKTEMESSLANYQSAQESLSLSKEGSRQEDVDLNNAAVLQAEAELANAQIQLEDTIIKAPSSGIIGKKSIELGEYISVGKPLFNITNLDDVWINANIEETYFGKITLGNPVEFTIDAYPGMKFTGEVYETSPATGAQYSVLPTENASGNFTKITQRIPIKIRPAASSYSLKPGMSAVVTIHVK